MSKRQEYSDGDSEQVLVDYFSGKPLPANTDLENDWRFKYHLSLQRHALVNWLNLKKGARTLEVGAGPGALTGALLQKGLKVTALELSERRARINRLRHKNSKNLELVVGNVENYNPAQKFDYVLCVGVLEYAGLFLSGPNAHKSFLEKLAEFLAPDGVLILAIENRFGLKYWAGAREDHTERFFDGLNDYPSDKGLQTFGKNELKDLLASSGFSQNAFYYPFPDYKMPFAVFSDNYLPGKHTTFPLGVLPSSTSSTRLELFSEALAMESLEQNGLFGDFSNSFLVLASKNSLDLDQPLFVSQGGRANQLFATQTQIIKNGSKKVATKKALGEPGVAHVRRLPQIYKDLTAVDGFKKLANPAGVNFNKTSGEAEFAFIEGTSLERIFWRAVKAGDKSKVLEILAQLVKLVESLPETDLKASDLPAYQKVFGKPLTAEKSYAKPGLIDVNFDNLIVDEAGRWRLIDYEWCFDFPVPKKYIVGRTLWWFFGIRYGNILRAFSGSQNLLDLSDGLVVPDYVYQAYRHYFEQMDDLLEVEWAFQSYVLGKKLKLNPRWRMYEAPRPTSPVTWPADELVKAREVIAGYSELEARLTSANSEVERLQAQITAMVNSRGWKALEKARKVKRAVKRK